MSGVKFGGFDQTIVRSNLKMQLALQGPWALGINLCRLHKAVEGGLQRIIIIIIIIIMRSFAELEMFRNHASSGPLEKPRDKCSLAQMIGS